jgi:hypothetical protein
MAKHNILVVDDDLDILTIIKDNYGGPQSLNRFNA